MAKKARKSNYVPVIIFGTITTLLLLLLLGSGSRNKESQSIQADTSDGLVTIDAGASVFYYPKDYISEPEDKILLQYVSPTKNEDQKNRILLTKVNGESLTISESFCNSLAQASANDVPGSTVQTSKVISEDKIMGCEYMLSMEGKAVTAKMLAHKNTEDKNMYYVVAAYHTTSPLEETEALKTSVSQFHLK